MPPGSLVFCLIVSLPSFFLKQNTPLEAGRALLVLLQSIIS